MPYICIRFDKKGSLAQLVQSVCLTSRGSGVRLPQLPLQDRFSNRSFFMPRVKYGLVETSHDPDR